jgi:hypothetical protein
MRLRKLLIGFGVLCLIIINDCAVLTAAVGMSGSLIPNPTMLSPIYNIPATLVAIPTMADITATFVPTLTVTPTITPTVEPTSTPLPTKDPADTVYLTSILDNLTDMQSDMMQVADGSQQAADNPYIIKTKAWQNAFFTATNDMERASQEISQIDVPVRFAKVQAILAQLYPEVKAMNEDLHKGVNEFDAKWINQGNGHLRNITDIIEKATLELEKVQR